jgi:hypothetical protein
MSNKKDNLDGMSGKIIDCQDFKAIVPKSESGWVPAVCYTEQGAGCVELHIVEDVVRDVHKHHIIKIPDGRASVEVAAVHFYKRMNGNTSCKEKN